MFDDVPMIFPSETRRRWSRLRRKCWVMTCSKAEMAAWRFFCDFEVRNARIPCGLWWDLIDRYVNVYIYMGVPRIGIPQIVQVIRPYWNPWFWDTPILGNPIFRQSYLSKWRRFSALNAQLWSRIERTPHGTDWVKSFSHLMSLDVTWCHLVWVEVARTIHDWDINWDMTGIAESIMPPSGSWMGWLFGSFWIRKREKLDQPAKNWGHPRLAMSWEWGYSD